MKTFSGVSLWAVCLLGLTLPANAGTPAPPSARSTAGAPTGADLRAAGIRRAQLEMLLRASEATRSGAGPARDPGGETFLPGDPRWDAMLVPPPNGEEVPRTKVYPNVVSDLERAALVALYSSAGGAGWYRKDSWLGAVGTECSWYGVTCDGLGDKVVGLSLTYNNLTGTLPTEMGDLKGLTTLDLSGNPAMTAAPVPSWVPTLSKLGILRLAATNRNGEIPDLSSLPLLQILDLGGNPGFNPGPVPSWITSVTLLKQLSLGNTGRTGTIPDLSSLAGLQQLYLPSNRNLTAGPIPSWVASMPAIVYLDLSATNRNGAIPNLSGLATLRGLYLSFNDFTPGPVPSWLNSMSALSILNLGSTGRTGPMPELTGMSGLTGIDLSGNPAFDAGPIPTFLLGLLRLNAFNLSSSNRTGAIPAGFGSVSNLFYVVMNGNALSGSIPADLVNLPLGFLWLSSNQLSGTIPNLGNVTDLDLSSNPFTAAAIPSWLQTATRPDRLVLRSTNRTGAIPSWLASLPSLASLDLSSNQLTGAVPDLSAIAARAGSKLLLDDNAFDAGAIPSWLQGKTSLTALGLGRTHLTGAVPSWLGGLTGLTTLRLDGNALQGALPAALTGLTNLTDTSGLDLRWNGLSTTDSSLRTFLNGKQSGGDWEGTQTLAPKGVSPGIPGATSVPILWTPIAYTADPGGYTVHSATNAAGPYTPFATSTTDKLATTLTVTGLTTGIPYYFKVVAFTGTHPHNTSAVTSDFSSPVVTATPGGGSPGQILVLDRASDGTGHVTSAPPGLDCTAACNVTFPYAQVVTLTATPDPNSWFIGWSGEGCSGTGSCQVTLDRTRYVTATFTLRPAGSSRFNTVSPCRIVDTRDPAGPYGGPALAASPAQRSFQVGGKCGVPLGALSVAANVTVTQAGAEGSLTAFPGDGTPGVTTSISFKGGETRANNEILKLSGDGQGWLGIRNNAPGAVHLILDVSGYFQ